MGKVIHKSIIQGSDEWFKLRCGKVTASTLSNILTPKKLELSSAAKLHAFEIAVERTLGVSEEGITTPVMEYGNEIEPLARMIYSDNIKEVQEVGFIENDSYDFCFGASPDGLIIGENGGIEIKSLCGKKYMDAVINNNIDAKHLLQMQGTMLAGELDFIDYIPFHEGMKFIPIRIKADPEVQQSIIYAGVVFEAMVKEAMRQYEDLDGIKTELAREI